MTFEDFYKAEELIRKHNYLLDEIYKLKNDYKNEKEIYILIEDFYYKVVEKINNDLKKI
jgi:hypothetical protein